jgi:two-component sensor histidine kinase
VVSELATNALVHAQTAFSVTLSASDTPVLLTVRDDSPALPEQRAARTLDASGLGLEIVAIIRSGWGINEDETGSKAIWASFAIRGPQEF